MCIRILHIDCDFQPVSKAGRRIPSSHSFFPFSKPMKAFPYHLSPTGPNEDDGEASRAETPDSKVSISTSFLGSNAQTRRVFYACGGTRAQYQLSREPARLTLWRRTLQTSLEYCPQLLWQSTNDKRYKQTTMLDQGHAEALNNTTCEMIIHDSSQTYDCQSIFLTLFLVDSTWIASCSIVYRTSVSFSASDQHEI